MKIPFICVNYSTSVETVKYINNVKSISDNNEAVIIVVDNSPSVDDFDIIRKFIEVNYKDDKNIVLIKRENKGYFQGLNDGILYAKELGLTNTFYVIGNNDIIFEDNFIFELKNMSFNENVLVIAPDIITNEGSHENPHVIEKMGFMRKFKYDVYYSHYLISKLMSKIKSTERRYNAFDPIGKEIHMGIGALYILTPNFFRFFDRLSEEVFLYGEEAILAGQINAVNGKILYEPALKCYHNESATTSQIKSKTKYEIVQKSYRKYRKYL